MILLWLPVLGLFTTHVHNRTDLSFWGHRGLHWSAISTPLVFLIVRNASICQQKENYLTILVHRLCMIMAMTKNINRENDDDYIDTWTKLFRHSASVCKLPICKNSSIATSLRTQHKLEQTWVTSNLSCITLCCWDGGCQACLRFNRITAEGGLPCSIMHCFFSFKVIHQLQFQVESIFQNKSPTNGIAIPISVAMLTRENVIACVSSNCKDVLIHYEDVLISNKNRTLHECTDLLLGKAPYVLWYYPRYILC